MMIELAKPAARKPAPAAPRRKRAPNGQGGPCINIRIRKPAYDKLSEIGRRRGHSVPELLERVIDGIARREKEVPDAIEEIVDRVDIIQKSGPPPSEGRSR